MDDTLRLGTIAAPEMLTGPVARRRDTLQRAVDAGANLIGVNHRDLTTFEIDLFGRLRSLFYHISDLHLTSPQR